MRNLWLIENKLNTHYTSNKISSLFLGYKEAGRQFRAIEHQENILPTKRVTPGKSFTAK